ncbi:ribosome small subunit-dependent GTPase A [Piscinibacter sp. HJYY11]|uniref:ribosome small subunit-dependent GTPase A n=1 Tax=Piscinibacter sp. HJYY11 TaxID=2801333 RepID=UPI00191E7A98|nr:ribosome small subunit-dependent GTPase A [Piscinibacter sp. HJYY11]MBL0727432.1 ribosome small subunit-dependent GTPase A [Piscinibacter sp. HJYY11]
MIDLNVERLRSIGLTPAMAQAAFAFSSTIDDTKRLRLLRVTEVHRETIVVHDGEQEASGRPMPRLTRELADAGTAIAVGDWVLLAPDAHGELWVHERIPPLTHIARRDADGRRHPVVSNVDTALLVMSLDDDFNPRRLERFLTLVQTQGVVPVVVLTKADVVTPVRIGQALDELRERLPAGLEMLALDGRDPASAQALAPWLGTGQTLVLLGSSGAGKSTLTNALLGAAVQDTGAVREHDSRGKHTTTSRSLHRLPSGACVIDTPGVRTLRPDVDEASLDAVFGDIAALAPLCRFRDCQHGAEPGCAVREGVSPDRLRNYQKLQRELRRDTQTALEREKQLSQWKTLMRAGRERGKQKRGVG